MADFLAATPFPGAITGRSVDAILGTAFAQTIRQRFHDGGLQEGATWQSVVEPSATSTAFDVSVRAHDGLLHLDLEPAGAQDAAEALTAVRQLQETNLELRGTRAALADLARITTRGIRLLTGYERVLIYRFDPYWNGEVISEDKVADWHQSLDGQTSPASNIPAQARELYRRSPMRWVPDRDAVQVPLDADPAWTLDGKQRRPHDIDLSFSRLRSLSPMHLQFHRSMGVNGSMSLSILREERLWGLVICHHRQPHHTSAGQQAAAAALTDAFTLRVGLAERAATDQARRGDVTRLSVLLSQMAEAEVVVPPLTTGDIAIDSLFASTGAAVIYDGDVTLLGQTPPEVDVRKLAIWLRAQTGAARLFQTNTLAVAYPPWEEHIAVASGLLAVFLSADRSDMLLWFRPEEPTQVNWGGNPFNGLAGDPSNPPRLSYEQWAETRRGEARPWAEWELEVAEALRDGITEVIIRSLRRIGELNDKLRQSHKMEAVGQLTGGIAHDFNNLLTGIIGAMDMIRTRVAQGRLGDLERYIDAATTSANRAAALTHRLLAFSRLQTLDPRAVDVNRLAASLDDLIRRTVGPAIEVKTVLAADVWTTLCDANQLENALLNLAINARDAMPDGGRLTIGTANALLDDDRKSRLHDVVAGHYVEVSVTDTGTGMSPEVAARVFEPFFTTKPLGLGTGLGLSMVYGFVKQSDGGVRIDSTEGRGTTVFLYLPRHFGPSEPVTGRARLAGAIAKAHETVLVVEDELVIRMLVGDALRELGYNVIEASTGDEGLRVLQSLQTVDLLVTDLGLPGKLNGRQLTDAARLHRPGLKVLFITGYAESSVLGNGVLPPGMQVITKPFAMATLVAKIRELL